MADPTEPFVLLGKRPQLDFSGNGEVQLASELFQKFRTSASQELELSLNVPLPAEEVTDQRVRQLSICLPCLPLHSKLPSSNRDGTTLSQIFCFQQTSRKPVDGIRLLLPGVRSVQQIARSFRDVSVTPSLFGAGRLRSSRLSELCSCSELHLLLSTMFSHLLKINASGRSVQYRTTSNGQRSHLGQSSTSISWPTLAGSPDIEFPLLLRSSSFNLAVDSASDKSQRYAGSMGVVKKPPATFLTPTANDDAIHLRDAGTPRSPRGCGGFCGASTVTEAHRRVLAAIFPSDRCAVPPHCRRRFFCVTNIRTAPPVLR